MKPRAAVAVDAPGLVVVGEQLQARAVGELVAPGGHQVAAVDELVRRLPRLVDVALHADVVARRRPVEPEAALRLRPAVVRAAAVRLLVRAVVEPLAVHAIAQVGRERAAVLQAGAALEVAGAERQHAALGLARGPGDDVDHAVDRVGAPQRRARPADHLDAVDVLRQHLLHVPVDAAEQRRIDAAAVDQDQQLVGQARVVADVEAARRDRVAGGVELRDFEVGREPQHLGDAGGARADDVVVADHVDRGGRVAERLGRLRDRGDLDVGELLDRQVAQVFDRLGMPGRRPRQQRRRHRCCSAPFPSTVGHRCLRFEARSALFCCATEQRARLPGKVPGAPDRPACENLNAGAAAGAAWRYVILNMSTCSR